MKYIDADKLIAEIERRMTENCKLAEKAKGFGDRAVEDNDILVLIERFQQEQPEVNLEEEIDELWDEFVSSEGEREDFSRIARHFYELGQSSQYQKDRAEFAKLKAKEWQKGFDEGLNARKGNENL